MTLWVGMYGQSNMQNMSSTSASPPAASAGTSYFDGVSIVAVPAGNGVRELLNGVKSLTGQDCAALNGAVAGVPIASLVKGQSAYTNFIAQIQNGAVGGVMNAIVFHQGEGDANADNDAATWVTALELIHTDLCADMGVTKAQCPMFIAGLATHTSSVYGVGRYARQQKAILDAADQLSNVYYSHSNCDAVLSDGLHWTGASYGRAGLRYARSIAHIRGDSTGPVRWEITAVEYVSPTQTDVVVAHGTGTDFTPTSGITGFEICSGGKWLTTTGARVSATRIRLTHVTATRSRAVRHCYGEAPTVTGIVVDNSAYAEPLGLTRKALSDDSHPVPVFISRTTASGSGAAWSATLATQAAFANRRIMVLLDASAAQVLSSATIGGIAATVHHSTNANSVTLAAISAPVPTGTSLTVALTFGGNVFNSANLYAWEVDDTTIDNASAVAAAVRATTEYEAALNLTNAAGAFTLALAWSTNSTSNSAAAMISDTDYERRIDIAGNGFQHVAFDSECLGQYISRPIKTKFPQSGTVGLLAVTWPPAVAVEQMRGRLR